MRRKPGQRPIGNSRQLAWSALALLAGLLLSALAAGWHYQTLRAEQQQRLGRLAERSFDSISSQLRTSGLLVRSVQALFMSSDDVSVEEFRMMHQNLDVETMFPSLQALGFARRRFDAEGREQFITELVAPLRGNERLVGLDITVQPTNMRALEASRDSNRPAMSEAFQLIQRAGLPGSKDGVTIRLPVFSRGALPLTVPERRERLIGSLVASFHVSTLIDTGLLPETRDTFSIRIIDVTAGLDRLLFQAAPASTGLEVDTAKYEFSQDIGFGGRIWQMQLSAPVRDPEALWWPLLTLAIGGLASVSFALMIWALLGTRARALALAQKMSAQFQESEARTRSLNELLSHQANHDELTGLANRRAFETGLAQAITAVNAGGDAQALLYLDLDQFKLVNDVSGHVAGDQLLAQLAVHIGGCLGPADLIARLGGDEFGVLLIDGEERRARASAERLREVIDEFVFSWEGKHYNLSASIGLVFLDRPGLTERELLSMADTACHLAKERGRNRLHVFEEDDATIRERRTEMEWIGRIRLAMSEGRMSLHFQELEPLSASAAGQGAHFELLLRMRDEQGQPVPPVSFIPAAERFGLMPQLDRWVVDTALANFDRLHPRGSDIDICAINLSGATVDDEHFAEFVLEALQRYQVPAHAVCFEITETAAVSNMARVLRFIERLRSVGCRFALDDFGAGMSSFGYLKNLPVDLIKIDGSFIKHLDSDPMSLSIVRAVTEIGHQVGSQVIAEWVDSPEARERLRELGVDFAQGYFIHKPEPAVYCR